jgi:menaquinone-dependent protoporphyrinogen IX oxidase
MALRLNILMVAGGIFEHHQMNHFFGLILKQKIKRDLISFIKKLCLTLRDSEKLVVTNMATKKELIEENTFLKKKLEEAMKWMRRQIEESRLIVAKNEIKKANKILRIEYLDTEQVSNITRKIDAYFD